LPAFTSRERNEKANRKKRKRTLKKCDGVGDSGVMAFQCDGVGGSNAMVF
jgi:hypothetical protein